MDSTDPELLPAFLQNCVGYLQVAVKRFTQANGSTLDIARVYEWSAGLRALATRSYMNKTPWADGCLLVQSLFGR